jgi:hypothetical protein
VPLLRGADGRDDGRPGTLFWTTDVGVGDDNPELAGPYTFWECMSGAAGGRLVLDFEMVEDVTWMGGRVGGRHHCDDGWSRHISHITVVALSGDAQIWRWALCGR